MASGWFSGGSFCLGAIGVGFAGFVKGWCRVGLEPA